MGTVYLVHFAAPIGDPDKAHGQARHYIGYTDDPPRRFAAHSAGRGAKIMAWVEEHGIAWEVARTWPGNRATERRIKLRKEAPALCPICSGPDALRRGADMATGG